MNRRMPTVPVPATALPSVVDRDTWQREIDIVLVREKAHTREGDAIAAARRRLPMVEIPADARRRGRVFETYWSTHRGTEAQLWSYALMDRTVFGRQEPWEDSPEGWPLVSTGEMPWRVDGRPIAQWVVTDEDVETAEEHCH